MEILDSANVDRVGSDQRRLYLASGNLAEVQPGIQYLGIWCDPRQYSSEDNEVIRELDALGVSVESLERRPACDFRPLLPCWISAPIVAPNVNFRQLLVWEPDSAADVTSALHMVRDAFQALNLFAGKANGGSAAFLLWPGKGADSPQDIFRMQFFSAMSLASRNSWSALYLLVKPEQANEAKVWFPELRRDYMDPPIWPRSVQRSVLNELELPERLFEWADAAGMTRLDAEIQSEIVVTLRQALALRHYTFDGYQAINAALRKGDLRHPDFIANQAMIEALSAGLAALPNCPGNVGRSVRHFDGFEDIYQPGGVSTELAFTSTTRAPGIENLAPEGWVFYIVGFLGKDVVPFSPFPDEEESLFDQGMEHLVWFIDPWPIDSGTELTGRCHSNEPMQASIAIGYSHL